jgi:serine phosphatase RsbU (regulator of sigma subunit)
MAEMDGASNADLQSTHQIIQFLEEAKAQSELILDSLSGLMVIINSKGQIFRCNQNFTDFLGIDFESEIGFALDKRFGPDRWKFLLDKMQMSHAASRGVDFEMEIVNQHNRTLSFHWNIRPIISRFSQVQTDLYILIGQDLTEIKSLTVEKSRMHQELLTAQAVQNTLFAESEFRTEEFAILGSYTSATECGGDWWFYNQVGNRVYLWIGDVTGHGVGAALVTSAARSAVSVIMSMPDIRPAEALQILNRAIYASSRGSKLMTFIAASVDLTTGDCAFASAGHLMPVLMKSQGGPKAEKPPEVQYLVCPPSLILGQHEEGDFYENAFKLEPHDRLFLYTDGVIELASPQGFHLGDRKFRQALQAASVVGEDVSQFMKKFNDQLEKHRNLADLNDDVTYFVFELCQLKKP